MCCNTFFYSGKYYFTHSVINTWNTASKLAESIKKNEVYAREAIYVAAGMNRYANFKVKKDGRVQSYLTNAFLLEKFNCGDKVILIQMGENYVWVYKARKDEKQITSNA